MGYRTMPIPHKLFIYTDIITLCESFGNVDILSLTESFSDNDVLYSYESFEQVDIFVGSESFRLCDIILAYESNLYYPITSNLETSIPSKSFSLLSS